MFIYIKRRIIKEIQDTPRAGNHENDEQGR